MKIPESVVTKALKALDQWTNHFMIIGNGKDETPRWAQLLPRRYGEFEGEFVLKSTQKDLYYELDLTPAEQRYLSLMNTDERWNQWREIRTKHLIENYKTINPY